MMTKVLICVAACLVIAGTALGQKPGEQQRLNTIKLEISQGLYPRSLVGSYERITRPSQSFCVTAGYQEFPALVRANSTIHVRQDLKRHGYRFGTEYRFYLKKENKYDAPHGLYVGPYVTYHYFFNERDVDISVSGVSEQAIMQTNFTILNVGIQLGHQFVINNRWTIDVITFGPAISHYGAKLRLDGDFTFNKDEVESDLVLKLLDTFPMLDELLTEKKASSQGRYDSWSYGWRVQLHVGYHFGRKKSQKNRHG